MTNHNGARYFHVPDAPPLISHGEYERRQVAWVASELAKYGASTVHLSPRRCLEFAWALDEALTTTHHWMSGQAAHVVDESGTVKELLQRPSNDYGAWEIETVDCVVCPGCAFTFDKEHTDTDRPGLHSCPVCQTREGDE